MSYGSLICAPFILTAHQWLSMRISTGSAASLVDFGPEYFQMHTMLLLLARAGKVAQTV